MIDDLASKIARLPEENPLKGDQSMVMARGYALAIKDVLELLEKERKREARRALTAITEGS